jgi:hypothetical protein
MCKMLRRRLGDDRNSRLPSDLANDVATEAHDRFVQATLDTMWLPEYED